MEDTNVGIAVDWLTAGIDATGADDEEEDDDNEISRDLEAFLRRVRRRELDVEGDFNGIGVVV
jgi:hypothetical protein